MGQFKKNDTIAEFDKNGKYVRTIQGPHRAMIVTPCNFVNGRPTDYRYELAPKGYNQPHKENKNNFEIVHFGTYHRRKYWKKRKQA